MLTLFAIEMLTYPDADDPRPTWLRLRCNFVTEGEAELWARGRRSKCRRRAVYRVVRLRARDHAAQVRSPSVAEVGGTSAVGCCGGSSLGTPRPERSEAQSGERSERASRPRSEAEHGPQRTREDVSAARCEVMS
jgi:hypothetical protein